MNLPVCSHIIFTHIHTGTPLIKDQSLIREIVAVRSLFDVILHSEIILPKTDQVIGQKWSAIGGIGRSSFLPISLIDRLMTMNLPFLLHIHSAYQSTDREKKLLIRRKLAWPISLIGNPNFVINIPDSHKKITILTKACCHIEIRFTYFETNFSNHEFTEKRKIVI